MTNTIKKPDHKGSGGLIDVLWMVVTLTWPLTRWLVALDVAWQGAKAVFGTGGLAGLVFLAHFAVFCALTYFVAFYRPKGMS